jgi:hypothetical protein
MNTSRIVSAGGAGNDAAIAASVGGSILRKMQIPAALRSEPPNICAISA